MCTFTKCNGTTANQACIHKRNKQKKKLEKIAEGNQKLGL